MGRHDGREHWKLREVEIGAASSARDMGLLEAARFFLSRAEWSVAELATFVAPFGGWVEDWWGRMCGNVRIVGNGGSRRRG